ncbi:MAG: response regulator transcription factor [Spartobacteria bacterium]|nr:response regulator transcription factor [Spartobacteria bacterium]
MPRHNRHRKRNGYRTMAPHQLIRIILADDHQLFLEGLQRLFSDQPDIQLEGFARTGREALALIEARKPDIVVLDIDMPDMDAFTIANRLAGAGDPPRIILLSMHNETAYLLAASRPDIQGYVLKDAAFDDLIHAVHEVHAGRRYMSAGIADDAVGSRSPLTPREQEVLRYAAAGLTTRQTADQLGLSAKTIETHRTNIIRKLDVANITEAVHITMRLR